MSLRHHLITFALMFIASVACAEAGPAHPCAPGIRASCPAPVPINSAEDDVRRVFELVQTRLSLMRAVAAWKYANNAPVTDAAREQRVLDASVAEAQRLGIDPASARDLFALQIRIASDVQEHFIASWRKQGGNAERVRDLNQELRPELDRIGAQLLQAVYLALPELARSDFVEHYETFASVIDVPGVDTADREQLLGALARLKSQPTPALERIKASRVLRVGVTGDYAPFTL